MGVSSKSYTVSQRLHTNIFFKIGNGHQFFHVCGCLFDEVSGFFLHTLPGRCKEGRVTNLRGVSVKSYYFSSLRLSSSLSLSFPFTV